MLRIVWYTGGVEPTNERSVRMMNKKVAARLREEFPEVARTGKFPRAQIKELLIGKSLLVVSEWPALGCAEVICSKCLEVTTVFNIQVGGDRQVALPDCGCGVFVIY